MIWLGATAFALALGVAAIALRIDSVEFDGRIDGGRVIPFTAAEAASLGRGEALVPPATDARDPTSRVARKEVGYVFAPNWALYSLVVVPLMFVQIVRVWARMRSSLAAVARAGMVRDAALARIEPERLDREWRGTLRACAAVFGLIFLATFTFVAFDWWTVVLMPIARPDMISEGMTLADPVQEFDWSIASLYPTENVGRVAVAIFGLAAYLFVAVFATAAAFATCIAALVFVFFICGETGRRRHSWRLVAMPCSADDNRGGFGHFAPFFSSLFGLCLAVVVGCLLMMIQNAYLRDPTTTDVANFLFGNGADLVREFKAQSMLDFWDWLLKWLLTPIRNSWDNPQTSAGVMLFALTSVITVGSSWHLLRAAARGAQDLAFQNLPPLARECGLTNAEMEGRLINLKVWPVSWMPQNRLLLTMGALMASVLSYRLMLLPLAYFAFLGGKDLLLKFFKDVGGPPPPRPRLYASEPPPTG